MFEHSYAMLEITVNYWSLFQTISAFGPSKSILTGQISYTFSMGQLSKPIKYPTFIKMAD